MMLYVNFLCFLVSSGMVYWVLSDPKWKGHSMKSIVLGMNIFAALFNLFLVMAKMDILR